MSALVSMHGLWFLATVPLAAVFAWRLHGPLVKQAASWVTLLLAIGLVGWFGYLAVSGTEFTDTVFDRAMHSIGVIVSSFDFPILQLLTASILTVCWPAQWVWQGLKSARP